mgnify:FL=1
MVATEAISGVDSYRDLADLANDYFGWQGVRPDAPHPRPPSTIALLVPLALVSGSMSIMTLALISAPALAFFIQSVVRWLNLPAWYELLAVPIAISLPIAQGLIWGTHIPLVAAAIGGYLIYKDRNPTARGALIGVATSLKVFPIALLLTDRRGQARAVAAAGAVILGLTAVGVLLPGVGIERALQAIFDAPGSFGGSPTDFSINRFFATPTIGTIAIWVLGLFLIAFVSRRSGPVKGTAAALILMLLFSPFAWPEYLLLMTPALFVMLGAGGVARWISIVAGLGLALTTNGSIVFAVCSVLLVALLVLPISEMPNRTSPTPTKAM